MNRLAVIDIGTHSILYLLVDINQKKELVIVDQVVRAVRLGKNIGDQGIIQDKPLEKAIHVLQDFSRKASDQHADRVIAVGTRVFRAAKNREQVCGKIQRETGVDVEVLSDREEAQWSYQGAIHGKKLDRFLLVVDIGGGSTELICGKGDQIEDLISINLGAVNLTEKVVHHDPPLREEIDMLAETINAALSERIQSLLIKGIQLVATGGTATTLGALQLQLDRYDPNRVDGYVLSLENLENLMGRLFSLPLSRRRQLIHFDPTRADIILAGSMILKTILSIGKFEEVMISDQGLRLGIALRAFKLDSFHHR